MAGYIGSKVAVVSSGAERKKVFTATSGQTSFTGLSYTVNNVHVFQNGVRLVDGTDYTATDGNSLTLTVGASTDDQVVVVSYNTFQTSDTVSASTGGTFAGDVNFTGAFTSQGIDDNATSTAMTLDASGNLLVGTTTPEIRGQSTIEGFAYRTGNSLDVSTTSGLTVNLNRMSTDGDIAAFRKDGSIVGSIGIDSGGFYVDGEANHTGVRFKGGAVTPRLNGTQADGTVNLGNATERYQDLYLSGGVYLGGTGASNHLDDYEEGTWTVTAGSNFGTLANRVGKYVKIGQMVYVKCYFSFSGASTTTSRNLSGLPFAAVDDFSLSSVEGSLSYWGDVQSIAYVEGTTIVCSVNSADLVFGGTVASSGNVRLHGWYRTTA